MTRPVRRRPVLEPPPPASGGSRWPFILAAACALLVLLTVVVGVEIAREVDRDLEGTTNAGAYAQVMTGQAEAQVVSLLGSVPRAVEAAPFGAVHAPRCYVWGRRSGRPGQYRVCFQDGVMVEKERVAFPT